MNWLRLIPTALVALTLSGAAWWLWGVFAERAALRDEVARQARSLTALETQIEQSKLARAVEEARAERWRARHDELAATIEQLREIPDAPLDPALIDLLDGLRPRED